MKELELTWFDVKGYMAHFRKFFSTTTSLSYIFPPRTTLMGLVAAIIGMDRDSYYELFSPRNLFISVRILSPIRVVLQAINHLKVKEQPEHNIRGLYRDKTGRLRTYERIQVTTEYVINGWSSEDSLTYRVYLASLSRDTSDYVETLKNYLSRRISMYPISLGPAYALAWIDKYGTLTAEVKTSTGVNHIDLVSPVPLDYVQEIDTGYDNKSIYYEEKVPRDMMSGRIIRSTADYLVPVGKPLKVRLTEGVKYYTFLEDGYILSVTAL